MWMWMWRWNLIVVCAESRRHDSQRFALLGKRSRHGQTMSEIGGHELVSVETVAAACMRGKDLWRQSGRAGVNVRSGPGAPSRLAVDTRKDDSCRGGGGCCNVSATHRSVLCRRLPPRIPCLSRPQCGSPPTAWPFLRWFGDQTPTSPTLSVDRRASGSLSQSTAGNRRNSRKGKQWMIPLVCT